MRIERPPGLNPALIFIAPALDVVLAMVFYLVLSTSFLLQPGVEVAVPDSPFLLAPQRDPIVVSIVAAPVSAIYFENEQVGIEELGEKLAARPLRNHTIILKADRHASFEQIARVMTVSLGLGYPTVIATAEEE